MIKSQKVKPRITPGTIKSLKTSLQRAITDEKIRKKIKISLQISGGFASQAYYFIFSTSGFEKVECEINDSISGLRSSSKPSTMKSNDIESMLKTILESGVLELPKEPPRFLPDTLVGRLEISDGESVFRYFYIADKEQAKTQHRVPPEALAKTAEHILRLGSKFTGKKIIKP